MLGDGGAATRPRTICRIATAFAIAWLVPQMLAAQQVAQRFSQNLRGSIDIVGNTLHTCNTNQSGCTNTQNGGNGANNDFNMVRVNVDPSHGNFASSGSAS